MSNSAYSRFVDAAVSFQGAPYIWGGKGSFVFDEGKLKQHKIKNLDNEPLMVFDCSGLVTVALQMATLNKLDLRASHSAKTMLDTFPICDENFGDGCLLLYPQHVAIDLGRGRVVDANRGTSKIVTVLDAMQNRAKVEVHRTIRAPSTLLGYRRIPLDKSELRVV